MQAYHLTQEVWMKQRIGQNGEGEAIEAQRHGNLKL